MQLKDKRVLVVGFGKTGKALTRFLLDREAVVTVNDSKSQREICDDLDNSKKRGAEFIFGGHPLEIFLRSDLIVISPGVDPGITPLVHARNKGIPVVSEIELASRFITSPVIGVTGTNGKTTTTSLIAEILRRSGFSVFLGGNIGTPLITFAQEKIQADFAVVELSSFQLETIETFTPHIAILLNITEDHLDRYPSFKAYCDAKYKIFMNQTERNFAIINIDNKACRLVMASLAAHVLPFSHNKIRGNGIYSNGAFLHFQEADGSTHSYSLSNVCLSGPHNIENMLAAIGTAELCGCPHEKVQEAIDGFRGLEHRLEYVQTVNDVSFYNDSKATNIDALLKSLQAFPGNIILIAGGKNKGGNYGVLKEEIQKRTKLLLVIGEAQELFFRLFGSLTLARSVNDLEEAVQVAFQNARKGDVVLLSPGCASFDMFLNYEERGRTYKKAVQRLARDVSSKE